MSIELDKPMALLIVELVFWAIIDITLLVILLMLIKDLFKDIAKDGF